MKYEVVVNKRFAHIRTYKVLKGASGGTNRISQIIQNLVDKYLVKKQS